MGGVRIAPQARCYRRCPHRQMRSSDPLIRRHLCRCGWQAGTGVPQLREFVLAELELPTLTGCVATLLQRTQLDATDLAGDGLRQLGELDAPNAFVCGEPLANEAEDLERHLTRRLGVTAQHT